MITAELVGRSIQFAQTAERIIAAIRSLQAVSDALKSIDADEALQPELHVAVDHLEGLLGALDRAAKFNNARMDVWLAQAKGDTA